MDDDGTVSSASVLYGGTWTDVGGAAEALGPVRYAAMASLAGKPVVVGGVRCQPEPGNRETCERTAAFMAYSEDGDGDGLDDDQW